MPKPVPLLTLTPGMVAVIVLKSLIKNGEKMGARLAGTLPTISSSKQTNNDKSVIKTRWFTLKL